MIKAESSYSFSAEWAKNTAEFEHGEYCQYTVREGKESCVFHYIKRDLSIELESLEKNKYFDIITPFDYGGFNCTDKEILKTFLQRFEAKCKKENIVSGFFRFNPMLYHEFEVLKQYMDIVKAQNHVVINLNTDFRAAYSSRKKRNINKAIKQNCQFIKKDSIENFILVYTDSMERVDASSYFYFDKNVLKQLLEFGEIFSIKYENKTVSSVFIIEDEKTVYYFLGGTLSSCIKYGFNSLLFDFIFDYYKDNKDTFMLGGGHNGLLQFKKEFSSDSIPFYIGKKVFLDNVYNKLVAKTNNQQNKFFPQYRTSIL